MIAEEQPSARTGMLLGSTKRPSFLPMAFLSYSLFDHGIAKAKLRLQVPFFRHEELILSVLVTSRTTRKW